MRRWLSKAFAGEEQTEKKPYQTVVEGLRKLYFKFMYPLEQEFSFAHFHSPLLTPGDFSSKPMVMLIGQYSTGKTTMIKHLLERDYPGSRIGPEPTTDRFVAVMHGEQEQETPGNAAVVDSSKPFSALSNYGANFLTRFCVAQVPSRLLKSLTIIDTPGVLAGSKQMTRGYEFESVMGWFAERVDLILLMFDAHKLDISDEFRRCITSLRGHDSKVRILLNKSDMISTQQLMRVYGALMWSLGKVIGTAEVTRVYIGSFWDQPLVFQDNRPLFEAEESDLYTDIAQLPKNAATRKVNDFIKRIRLLKVHCVLLNYLRKQLPMFGKESKKKDLISGITGTFALLSRQHELPLGDFPPPDLIKAKLAEFDWTTIPRLDANKYEQLKRALDVELPQIMRMMPQEMRKSDRDSHQGTVVNVTPSPFNANVVKDGFKYGNDRYLKSPPSVALYEEEFKALGPDGQNRIGGNAVKDDLVKSKLPNSILHRIWSLADIDGDGHLTLYEYALARHLINMKLDGLDLPEALPRELSAPPVRGYDTV